MSKKNIIAAIAAVTLILGAGSAALAGPHNGGNMGQRGMVAAPYQQLTPEKQQAVDSIMKEHFDKVQPLQQQMWAKNTELRALSQNPNTKPEMISQLVKDLSDLRVKLDSEYKALSDKLEAATGIKGFGPHGGMMGGRGGMGGYHDGMMGGRGGHNGGHGGNGSCIR